MGKFTDSLNGLVPSIIGTGMGLLLEGHNDRRQIRQQQKLTDMQVEAQRNLTSFSFDKQMEMWEKTNYSAQKEQLEKAGLNPALLYGTSGGGATTTGTAGATGVSGGHAPTGGGEIMGMMMQKMQMQMMQAQVANTEAQTEKTKAETAKTTGVDTELAKAQITNYAQGVENSKAQQALTETQTRIAKVSESIASATEEEAIARINIAMQTEQQELDQMVRENWINDKMKDTKMAQIRADLAQTLVENILIKQQTTESQSRVNVNASNIQVNQQQLHNMSSQIVQKWQEIENQGIDVETRKGYLQLEKSLRTMSDFDKMNYETFQNVVQSLIGIAGKPKGFSTTTIRDGNETHSRTTSH